MRYGLEGRVAVRVPRTEPPESQIPGIRYLDTIACDRVNQEVLYQNSGNHSITGSRGNAQRIFTNVCILSERRESDPRHKLGKLGYYHYTTLAVNLTILLYCN